MGNFAQPNICQPCQQLPQKLIHPAYGQYYTLQRYAQIIKNRQQQIIIQKYKINNRDQPSIIIERKLQKKNSIVSKVANLLKQKQNLIKCKYITKLLNYQLKQDDPYCYLLRLNYQFVPKTLSSRIKQLNFIQNLQFQISSLIVSIQIALKSLQKYSSLHYNIQLETILYSDNQKIYMICDNKFLTNTTNYQKILRNSNSSNILPLSQKLLYYLKATSMSPPYNIQDDLFSLGLICLGIITNNGQISIFYDWEKKQLKKQMIDIKLLKCSKIVSSRIVKKINRLIYGQKSKSLRKKSLSQQLIMLNNEYQSFYSKMLQLSKKSKVGTNFSAGSSTIEDE